MAICVVYGTDVTIESVIKKGNFDQFKAEVDNLSAKFKTYLFTKDSTCFSNLFSGESEHLCSKFFAMPDTIPGKLLGSAVFSFIGIISFFKRNKEIKIVVSQGTISLQGALANFLFKKPHILFLHYFAFNEQNILKRNLLSCLFRKIESFSIRHSDVVIAPNERLKDEALGFGAKKVQVIPNFIDLEEVSAINSREALRQKFKFKLESKMILFVGRLHPVKNLDVVFKALSNLDDNYCLVLVGEGSEKQRLQDLAAKLGISSRVRFEGFKSKKVVFEYMKASDVLILSSLVEGQPRVVLESWACGLPVVASRVEGIYDLINDQEDGLLFAVSSPELLSEAIVKSTDPKYGNILKSNGKARAKQYSCDKILALQFELVHKIFQAQQT